jgi:outer membrane lipoprotein-sorting protein
MKLQTGVWMVCVALAIASPVLAETVDEVVQKSLEAIGGEEAWLAVQSAKVTGTMLMGGSAAGAVEAPFTIEFKRPDKVRLEFTLQGMTAVSAYDGTVGWAVMPFMGKTEPEEMAEDQLKDIKDQAEFEGVLCNAKAKGHTVELLGEEEVDGTSAYKLKVTKANGDIDLLYLDMEYFLVFKSESTREIQGSEVQVTSVFGDFKEVGGLLFPHSMEIAYGGGPAQQVITIDNIVLGVEVADERFAMPAKPAAGEAAPQ